MKGFVEIIMDWIAIDEDYRELLPKEDCELWITRVFFNGSRFVQKIDFYYSETNQDIEYDGTIAWKKVINSNEDKPEPYELVSAIPIQFVR